MGVTRFDQPQLKAASLQEGKQAMPRRARNVTTATIESLIRKAKGDRHFRAWVSDGGQKGLGLWARETNVSFYFSYTSPETGKRRREFLARVEDIGLKQARSIARERLGLTIANVDPQEQQARLLRDARTLKDAADAYLEDLEAKGRKPSSIDDARGRLRRDILPVLGRVRLRSITREQVTRLHRSLKETPTAADRTLAYLPLGPVFVIGVSRGVSNAAAPNSGTLHSEISTTFACSPVSIADRSRAHFSAARCFSAS